MAHQRGVVATQGGARGGGGFREAGGARGGGGTPKVIDAQGGGGTPKVIGAQGGRRISKEAPERQLREEAGAVVIVGGTSREAC